MNQTPEDDPLLRRLRAADPAAASHPDERRLDDLLEETMSTRLDPPARRPGWVVLAAAAVAAVVFLGAAGAGIAAILSGGDDGATTVTEGPTVLDLTAPAEDPAMMCGVFSVEVLAQSPVAFEGTAVEVGEEVVLQVERWYAGGDAEVVRVAAPNPDAVPLLGAVRFVDGGRYLVAADRSAVSPCGLSGEWSAQLAAAYEQAFADRA